MEIYIRMKENINFMKRGISPLISYVFLVALAVAIGMIVATTLIDRVDDVEIEHNIDYCKEVSIALEDVCKDSSAGIFKLNLTNNGAFSIRKITFGRETEISMYQWCAYSGPAAYLVPGETRPFELSLNYTYASGVDQTIAECSDLNLGDYDLAEITILPWIEPDPNEEIIHCDDQKIIWDKDLNVEC